MSSASKGRSSCSTAAILKHNNHMTNSVLTLEEFARLLGTTSDSISANCRSLIDKHDFRYRILNIEERDQVLLEVLKRIESEQFSLAGKAGKERWEKGWAENRDGFLKGAGDPAELIPKYIRPGQHVRIDQQYATTADPNFEFNWYEIFRLWLFQTYLADVDTVYEFGCGSGFNLAALAKLYPDKKYYGLDWVQASVDIANELGKTYGWDMHGQLFDFFAPDRELRIEENSAVLTIGALEQTGTDYGAFMEYLLDASPKLCIHIEPIIEWYDENNLVDYAGIRFLQKRKYWSGFPKQLEELERKGQAEIVRSRRSYFGSLYVEGYSQLIWRPK